MNEVILLVLMTIGCIILDAFWYWIVKHKKCHIYRAFSHLLGVEACIYVVGLSMATNKVVSVSIIAAMLGVLVISAFILGGKCDQLSDEEVTFDFLLAKESQWANELEIKRQLFTIISVIWMVLLMVAIPVYTMVIMGDNDLLRLFANCTIFISAGLIFALIYGYFHNEVSLTGRVASVPAEYRPPKPRLYEIPEPYSNPYRIPLA